MLLHQLITGELKLRLKRNPTQDEVDFAYKNIVDNFGDEPNFHDLCDLMDDYISDKYFCCDVCGEYHSREEMNDLRGAFGFRRVCQNPYCIATAKYDVDNNQYQELRTY